VSNARLRAARARYRAASRRADDARAALVAEVRAVADAGASQREIADALGVSRQHVAALLKRGDA
jgi:DNA-binding transcriptional regulator LsrR (DeoR family)